jgi:ribosomal protein S12 methylthiotransferase accessory factor
MSKTELRSNIRVVETPEADFVLSEHEVLVVDRAAPRQALRQLLHPSEKDGPPATHEALSSFEEAGILRPAGSAASPKPTGSAALFDVYWNELAGQGYEVTATPVRTPRARVMLRGEFSSAFIDDIEKAFALAKFDVVSVAPLEASRPEPIDSSDVSIVLTDDYIAPEIDSFQRRAGRDQRPWCLAKPVGTTIWLGPLFVSDSSVCYSCLTENLLRNRPLQTYLARKHGAISATPMQGMLPSTLQTTLALLGTEIWQWQQSGQTSLLDTIVSYDTREMTFSKHRVRHDPRCQHCSAQLAQQWQVEFPPKLTSRKKTFQADGGHRTCSAEETFAAYSHLVSPLVGIIRNISKVETEGDEGDSPVHTYVSQHHFRPTFDSLPELITNLRGRSAGKGASSSQSMVSAMAEAVERYSTCFYGDEDRIVGSLIELGDDAIHPNACMLYSDKQYLERLAWNETCPHDVQRVPIPFDEREPVEWSPVWSLTHDCVKYLPTGLCYHGYPLAKSPSCWAETNGTAAGNCLEEAILQALFELIERDAVSIWWYNRLRCPRVDLDSFDDPYIREVEAYLARFDRDLWVLEVTMDIPVPVFVACSSRTSRRTEDIILGCGAHLDAKVALRRAITEMNQNLPSVSAFDANGDTVFPVPETDFDRVVIDWYHAATKQNQAYLTPSSAPPRGLSSYTPSCSDDVLADVTMCQKLLQSKGLEVLIQNQTRPEARMPVVKVFVPGLRPVWRRVAPGRLYTVPVELKLRHETIEESLVNPIFFFL